MSTSQENEKPFVEDLAALATRFVKAWGLYLGAIGVAILAWTKFKEPLDKIDFRVFEPWKYHLVLGIPVFLALVHLAARFRKRHLDRRRREWAAKGPPKPGYFRLTPYQTGDREDFHRADGAHERILSWLRNTDQILLYLTGRSGSGKSSLLNAFVIPSLMDDAEPACVINVRAFDDPVAEIKAALLLPKSVWERPPRDTEHPLDLLQRATQYLNGKRLILILDQFEEFVILHEDGQERARLRSFFSALLERPEDFPKLTILLTLRDDYLAPTREALDLPIHSPGKNWEQVELFVQTTAFDFLNNSHEGGLHAKIITQILEEAADIEETPGLFRPITLNMLGKVIAETAGRSKGLSPGQVLRDYLRRRLQDPEIRDFAPKILRPMATRFRTKRPLSETEITAETKIPIVDIQGSLVKLESDGIVRRFDRSENRLWEISHDFVARLITLVLAGWRDSIWRTLRPWISPIILTTWLATLAFGVPLYIDREHDRVTTLLSKESITVQNDKPGQLILIASEKFGYRHSTVLLESAHKLNGTITHLVVNRAGNLMNLSGLSGLTSLQRLKLNGARSLTDLSGLSGLTSLQTLDVSGAGRLTDLSGLSGLTSLQTLNVNGAGSLTDLNGLSGLTSLQTLKLNGADSLTDLSVLSELTSLQTLDLSGGSSLTDLSGLSGLMSLQTLDLSLTDSLTDLSGLSGLMSLQTLGLSFADSLTDLSGLSGLTSLQTLDLSGARSLTNLSGLSGLMSLQTLDLSLAGSLTDLSGLSGLTSLQTLDLSFADSLTDLSGLSGLTSLQTLDLSGISSLTELRMSALKKALKNTQILFK